MTETTLDPSIPRILDALYVHHGRPEYDGPDDLLGTLVRTIISQQTTSANASQAFGRLLDEFRGDWGRMRAASTDDIAETIDVAGLANQKAERIHRVLETLEQERGEYSLAFLRELGVEEAREYLTSFKGVGPKTAAFTLMYAADMPVFPMDTHIIRICKRLGWLDDGVSNQKAHDRIEPRIPDGEHYAAHIVLVRHGRQICHARSPECGACPILEWCPTKTTRRAAESTP